MFLKFDKSFFPSTAIKLVLWSTLILGISLQLTDLITGPYMRARLLERDKVLITYKMKVYYEVYQKKGLDSLIQRLKDDDQENRLQGIVTAVEKSRGEILWLTAPYGWEDVKVEDVEVVRRLPDGFFFILDRSFLKEFISEFDFDKLRDRKIALIKNRFLQGKTKLQVGRAAFFRQEVEKSVKSNMKYIFLMILSFNAFFGIIIFRFSLRSLRDLIRGMKTLSLGDIHSRIPVRNSRTELGTIAKLFNDSLDRIAALINGMKEALDNVAHDLKTPMSRIRLTIEKSVQSEDKEVLREALFDCAEEVNQIELMLKTLMDISEAEVGVLQLHESSFNLKTLVDECLNLYEGPLEMKELSLTSDIPAHIDLLADRIRIKQAISNLLDNAIKYSEASGHITISAKTVDEQVEIAVSDTGIGIQAENLDKIFDRLYRIDKSRSKKGLGLGLSLVKAVITAHGGEIKVKSQPNQGSTFFITI